MSYVDCISIDNLEIEVHAKYQKASADCVSKYDDMDTKLNT